MMAPRDLSAYQRAYDLIARQLGAPAAPSPAWRMSMDAFYLHLRVMSIIRRIERAIAFGKPA